MDAVLGQLATVAVFMERATQFLKSVVKYNEWAADYQRYIDIGVSVIGNMGLCYLWGVDLFAAAGIVLPVPWGGAVLTGAVASLGSSVVHELVELLKLLRAGASARWSA